jgi:hypothetical protein
MRWWVNESRTYRYGVAGGYFWSAPGNSSGARSLLYGGIIRSWSGTNSLKGKNLKCLPAFQSCAMKEDTRNVRATQHRKSAVVKPCSVSVRAIKCRTKHDHLVAEPPTAEKRTCQSSKAAAREYSHEQSA